MFNSLKGKIAIPIIGILLIVLVSIVIYVASSTRMLVSDFEDDRLTAAVRSVQAYLDSHRQSTMIAAIAMGNDAEMVRRLNDGARLDVWQYLTEKKTLFGVDEIIVADAQGITVARSHMRDSYGDDVSGVPSMAAGLRGEVMTLYTPTPTAYMVITSASPVMDRGQIIGSVVVNFVLSSDAFIDGLRNTFDVDITVFRGDESVASTLINPANGNRAVGTNARPDIAETVVQRGETMTIQLDVFGVLPYLAHYFPLRGAGGNITGMMFVGIPQAHGAAVIASQRTSIILIGIAGLLVAGAIMYFVIAKALKPLGSLTKSVKEVAAGNFNINFNTSDISKDEIGALTHDVYALVGVMRDIVEDLIVLDREYNKFGKMKYRADSSKYQNAFKDLVENVNAICDAEIDNLMDIMEILNKFSDGDFDIQVEDMPGDHIIFSQSYRAVAANLKNVSDEVNAMIEAAVVKGDLNFKIDETKYKGNWRRIMVGLNDIAKAVDTPLQVIKVAFDELSAGRFNLNELDKKLTSLGMDGNIDSYPGVFNDVMNSIESMIINLSSYVDELEESLAKMADGDLRVRIEREYVGSFDLIRSSVNNISSALRKTMLDISVAADQVLSGASQISNSSTDLANGTQEQASSIQELNASIDMINQQTTQNASNAQEANTLSNKSTENAKEGNEAMSKLMESMLAIKESNSNISSINRVIQDIAFQTNLLALNAAVEAARAGEQGKGFAVVAEEVRNLAARSQTAAEETTGMIEESISRVDMGSGIAESTAEALSIIVGNAEGVLQIINHISESSREQSEAVGQVSAGLEQISSVVQSNSAVSEETAAAAEELSSQAELLRQLVAYFRV